MKKLYLIIIISVMAVTGFAQQPETGDIVYVYQKDGDIHAFLRSEITEFYYGFEDENGVTQNEPVMQWIVMEDSICKIPLANIDSISFVTPETEYQPDVTRLEKGLMDYVERCDSLTLYLSADTPKNLIPKKGDKLVTTEMNDRLPWGFMGKVKEVSGKTITCEAVSLKDIFKRYYYVGETDVSSENPTTARTRGDDNKPFEKSFNLPEWNQDFTNDIALKLTPKGELALKGTTEMKLNVKPKMTIKYACILDGLNTTLDIGLRGDFDVTETYGIYGGLEFKPDFIAPPEGLPIAPVAPGAYLYWKPGIYFQIGVMASLKSISRQHFVAEKNFHASLRRGVVDDANARITSTSTEVEGCIDGTIGIGGFLEFGVTFLVTDLDHICLRGELGIEQNSHFVLYNKDVAEAQKVNKVYEALKASNITTSIVLNTLAVVDVPLFNFTHHLPLKHTWPLLKEEMVPTFDNVEFTQCYSPRTSANVAMNISGDIVLPEKIGFQIVDEDGKEICKQYDPFLYEDKERHWETRVDGLEDDGDYMVSPIVNFLGFDLLAYPTMHIDKNPFPVRIVNFEQTGSHYSKQKGYEYDGRNYFYKFNACTTVELSEDAKNVKDWGYYYHDFYGEHKKISCANLGGKTYPDVRYAYYYNEPERTVNLYPYVQFEGESEIQKGKEKEYPVEYILKKVSSCPDDKHPHLIDLGLPSGTLWSCCSLGAESPEELGDYYKWGETKKTNIKWYAKASEIGSSDYYNYEFYIPEKQEFVDIGPDISGTRYDAARVNWGSPWRMPTRAQVQELADNCSAELVKSGEVAGIVIHGPNGHKIYFRTDENDGYDHYYENGSESHYEVHDGGYWTSTLYSPILPDYYAVEYIRRSWYTDPLIAKGYALIGAVNREYMERALKENYEASGEFLSPRFLGFQIRAVVKR